MHSFEGIFRSKPSQNYSGNKYDKNSHSLVQRNREERRKRELVRLQENAAIKIQSFVRVALVRMAAKRYTRQLFDDLLDRHPEEDPASFITLLKSFNNFFDPHKDQHRLMVCCSLIISTPVRSRIEQWIQGSCTDNIYLLGRFVTRVVSFIEHLPPNSSSATYSSPFRVIEIALPSLPAHPTPAFRNNLSLLLRFLVAKGFFRSLAAFIDRQAMAPDLEQYDHAAYASHPKVSSMLLLLNSPLRLGLQLDQGDDRMETGEPTLMDEIVRTCISSIYMDQPQHNYHVNSKILQVIGGSLSSTLPLSTLAGTLIIPLNSSSSTLNEISYRLTVPPSLGLLHLISHWLFPTIDITDSSLSQSQSISALIVVISLLIGQLSPDPVASLEGQRGGRMADRGDDSDEEMEESSTKSMEENQILTQLYTRGADLLRLSLIDPDSNSSIPVSYLFYHLVYHHQMPLSAITSYTSVLAQSMSFLYSLWNAILSLTTRTPPDSHSPAVSLLGLLSTGGLPTDGDLARFLPLVTTFASCFHHRLLGLHDSEVMATSGGFEIRELVEISGRLRDLMHGLIELGHPDSMRSLEQTYHGVLERMEKGVGSERSFRHTDMSVHEQRTRLSQWSSLFYYTQRVVSQLYARDRRLHFCSESHWLKPSVADGIHLDSHSWLRRNNTSVLLTRVPFGYYSLLNPDRDSDDTTPLVLSTREARQLTFLVEMPFVVPFEKRVNIFQSLVRASRESAQGTYSNPHLDDHVKFKVRRSHLYEDAFEKLSKDNEPDLHPRLRVEFLNLAGAMEAGIDGGGLSREFLAELLKTGFDPNRGFFIYSEDKTLYPSPQAETIAPDYRQHFFFLGRMLAKAIYEGMLVELSFGQFFLAKVLSRTGGEVDIDYLQSLDSELYKNLLYLKTYSGDVSSLELDFTTMRNMFGKSEVVDLKSDGRNIPVTQENRIEYIHLVAHYKLNRQIRPHVNSFIAGMNDVVPIDWLRLFDPDELQMLISGADNPIDVEDLKQHTIYLSGTQSDSATIQDFWTVLVDMSDQERRDVLRFVTSCSRAPMFGFRELHPPFAIQLVPDTDRLPSSSTCMNLLKLPDFKDETALKEKLLYAIHAGAGFELS